MTGLEAHLQSGTTTVVQCWLIERRDGVRLGFTDHDMPIGFDGISFAADGGLGASAVVQGAGLAVDNLEAEGILSHAGLTHDDIEAGRYDGARVRAWLVNWTDPEERRELFSGSLGQIEREGGAFRAELRGLTQPLNVPRGRVYRAECAAILGDDACGVDLARPEFSARVTPLSVAEGRRFEFDALPGFEDGWFARGRLTVEEGAGAGLSGLIRTDEPRAGGGRVIELWQSLRTGAAVGPEGSAPGAAPRVRLEAGCARTAAECRFKFGNYVNFRGFPHLPGEDWLMAYPRRDGANAGGSLQGGQDRAEGQG